MKKVHIRHNLRDHPEFAQGIIRLGIWTFWSVFMGISLYSDGDFDGLRNLGVFSGSFVIFSIAVLVSIARTPDKPLRRYLTIPMDFGSISYAMILTGAGPFSPYFLIYPWAYISYGVRYGRGPLFAASAASLFGYLLVLALTGEWRTSPMETTVYILFLVILPLYLNAMINQLHRARTEADRANRAKSEFLATMSHEIRTPMSGIIGLTRLLSRTRLSSEQKEFITALEESSHALHSLIDDVLDISKIESGKYQLRKRHFRINDVVDAVAQMFTPTAAGKGVELISYVQPDIPAQLVGDPDRVRQILLNLVSNAVKFCEEGEITIHVIRQDSDDDQLCRLRFEVQDTGIGIAADHLANIFEPFYQGASEQRKQVGTGLGTTISRNLVQLMRGEIGADSTPGEGSCFWFEIPFETVADTGPAVEPLRQASSLLILDDNLTSRQTLLDYCDYLNIGYEVVETATELQNRLKTLPADAFDLILIADSKHARDSLAIAGEIRRTYSDKYRLCQLTYMDELNRAGSSETVFDYRLTRPLTAAALKRMIEAATGDGSETPADEPASDIPAPQNIARKVLIAEDSDINARVLMTFLEQGGHEAKRVENGRQALAELQKNDYDFVLMDMRMPEMDGLETTRQWRAMEHDGKRLPIFALTANATLEDEQACLAAGMDGFLTKPVNPDTLARILSTGTSDSLAD
ncbi:MAG TPA: response regulator [Gammaproteobacteria bacterium]|nr:response regulator [Gammaproteobacteria bacterium]